MATGLQGSNSNQFDVIRLLEAELAACAPVEPAVLAAVPTNAQFYDLTAHRTQRGKLPDGTAIRVRSTAGSGVMTCAYVRIWLADKASATMFPYGVGADADKGKLNNGGALGEDGANIIRHDELVPYLGHADGIMAELGALGGTATAITVELIIPRTCH